MLQLDVDTELKSLSKELSDKKHNVKPSLQRMSELETRLVVVEEYVNFLRNKGVFQIKPHGKARFSIVIFSEIATSALYAWTSLETKKELSLAAEMSFALYFAIPFALVK